MKKLIILSFCCSMIFADQLDILQNDKKELREIEKKLIQEKYKTNKNDWIGTLNISSSIGKNHNFTTNNTGDMSRNLGLSFSQSIFESGGIEYSIEFAKEQLNSDLISWENENIAILQTIYETLLNIKKINIQIKQSEYALKNKDIELILKRIQYEAGKIDIVELNNALMSKNNQLKEIISLKNSLKNNEYELSKYTNLRYDEIKLIDFTIIDKEKFLKDNLNISYEDSKVKLLDTSYKQLKSSYLPKVSISSSASYQNNQNEEDRTTGNIGLNMSMPIFDITKSSKLQSSKLEILKQRANINDKKSELKYEYEQILASIDTYENYDKTIKENLKLYEELIQANRNSNSAGMTSTYDLEILENTKLINEYDLKINDINKKLQYSKLYFKTKVDM